MVSDFCFFKPRVSISLPYQFAKNWALSFYHTRSSVRISQAVLSLYRVDSRYARARVLLRPEQNKSVVQFVVSFILSCSLNSIYRLLQS